MSMRRVIQCGKGVFPLTKYLLLSRHTGTIAALTLCLMLSAAIPPAQGQSYPTKAIKLVVGFPPGGQTDVTARTFSTRLSAIVKQPVIVDNRPGAGGNVAAGEVARADKDGYTLLFTHIATHGISPGLYRKLSYNAKKDFSPIILLVKVPTMLVVTPSLPVKNVPELIEYLRKNPGKVNYASGGNGVSDHLAAELFKSMTKTQMTHIPYKGASAAYPDLISGKVQVMFNPVVSIYPYVRSGRLRALGVGSKTRVPMAPDIPTIDESVPGFEVNSWFGVVAPKGTPSNVITFLNQAFSKILQQEDTRKQLYNQGQIPVGGSPSEFGAFIDSEIEKWGRVVKSIGLKID
jgi:tripartite-type tricarboxylate transporter receptor subunit TctC